MRSQDTFRRALAGVALLAMIGAGASAWRSWTPRGGCGGCGADWKTRTHLSPDFNASMVRLYAISDAPRISDSEAQEMLATLDDHIERLPHEFTAGEMSPEEESATIAASYVYATLGERLRFGGVSDAAFGMFGDRVVRGLGSRNPRERTLAIQAACYGRLVADPGVRGRVERLRADASEAVAAQAERQLAHFDRIAAMEQEGRWREPPPSWR